MTAAGVGKDAAAEVAGQIVGAMVQAEGGDTRHVTYAAIDAIKGHCRVRVRVRVRR